MSKHILRALALIFALTLPLAATDASARNRKKDITVAIFSVNDFHGGFVRNDYKQIPGAAALLQTLDSLKSVYPVNITVSAGDNFGGSFFYNATKGQLLPVLFSEMGIDLSSIGNHEFDDGQDALAAKWTGSPLRPKHWNIDYVCANVRGTDGAIPAYAQPFASRDIFLPNGKSLKVGFVGLIASSTPSQVSKRRIQGLSFDGRYTGVLDSVAALPGFFDEFVEADIRLLLTHIGSDTDADGAPIWSDADTPELLAIDDPELHGILSSHSHKIVCGRINKASYPIVQGKWHGEYISMLRLTLDGRTLHVKACEPELIKVNPDIRLEPRAQRMQALVDSLLANTRTSGGAPLGERLTTAPKTLIHDRDDKFKQTLTGALVCRAYAECYRRAAGLPESEIIVGTSHFGSIRAGFTEGPVSVLDVGEILPFANPLRVVETTGQKLLELVEFGLHNQRYGWIQTSWLRIDRDAEGHVSALAYVGPDGKEQPISASTKVTIVADEFQANGGDGYCPKQFEGNVVDIDLPMTTDCFINYLKTLPQLPEK